MASSPSNPSAAMPPRSGAGSTPDIDPQLENVLRNLNVNLEDELTRYRRQRHGRVAPPPPPRRMAQQRHTIDLISVPASSEGTVAPEVPSEVPSEMPSGKDTSTSVPAGQRPTPPPAPPNPFLDQEPELETEFDLPDVDPVIEEPSLDLDGLATELAGADANTALPVPTSDTPNEGYLESSEELLKSMADDQAEPDSVPEPYSPERKNNGLLKLAGLILVLLGGVGVGFAITYPSQLQNLRSQIWPTGTESPDTVPPTTTPGEAPPTVSAPPADSAADESEVSPDGYKPPGPDLSTREFKELDLESLSTLDVDGTAATSPSANPSATSPTNASGGAPATPPLTNPAQTPIPAATPAPEASAPATPSGTAPAAPAASTTPAAAPAAPAAATTAGGANFYVIASYTGDASLNKAREVVPDAFVRNFQAGARIQLAAFDNLAQAEDQVKALNQQGAAVELFGPTNE